ncbi:hypothetical protein MMC20_000190 [Loxospora ochrophaea]|nr:hypothetical protein [Loxospora ochrophaea]
MIKEIEPEIEPEIVILMNGMVMRTIRETKSERWFQNLVDQEFMKFGRRLINAEEKWPEPSDAVNCYSYNSEQSSLHVSGSSGASEETQTWEVDEWSADEATTKERIEKLVPKLGKLGIKEIQKQLAIVEEKEP